MSKLMERQIYGQMWLGKWLIPNELSQIFEGPVPLPEG